MNIDEREFKVSNISLISEKQTIISKKNKMFLKRRTARYF